MGYKEYKPRKLSNLVISTKSREFTPTKSTKEEIVKRGWLYINNPEELLLYLLAKGQ